MSKSIVLGILFFIGLSVTFVHIEFDKLTDWKPYALNKKKYKPIISKANKKTRVIIDEMRANGLGQYADRLEKVQADKKTELKAYTLNKNKLKSDFKFLGYSSKRVFWYDIGKTIFPIVPILILLIILFNPNLIVQLKKFLIICISGLMFVSLFWLSHNLFSNSDFSVLAYRGSYILVSVISTLIIFSLVRVFTYIYKVKQKTQEDLKGIIELSEEYLDLKTN